MTVLFLVAFSWDTMFSNGEEKNYTAKVVKFNPKPAPSQQRVLMEVRVQVGEYEPMSSKDYQPIID